MPTQLPASVARAAGSPRRLKRVFPANRGPDGREFTWGPIQRIHEVGRYHVVEYLVDRSGGEDRFGEHGMARFMPYVDKESTSSTYHTLDDALLGAMCALHGEERAYVYARGVVFDPERKLRAALAKAYAELDGVAADDPSVRLKVDRASFGLPAGEGVAAGAKP